MITLEEFKKEKIAINTKNQEEYDSLMRFFESKGIKWFDNSTAIEKEAFSPDMTDITKHYVIYDCGLEMYNYFICRDWKIITPTQLKEYNEFMGSVELADDIEVGDLIYKGEDGKYHKAKPPKESEYLTIGQAIDYMLESEDNVVERSLGYFKFHIRYNNGKFEEKNFCDKNWHQINGRPFYEILQWKNLKKYIEPKQKTLKDLIENKESFEYKDKQYRFNKDGAIIDNRGSAISIELTKELLTK
jgi:hypothetical protein